jgi:hypothetical protein
VHTTTTPTQCATPVLVLGLSGHASTYKELSYSNPFNVSDSLSMNQKIKPLERKSSYYHLIFITDFEPIRLSSLVLNLSDLDLQSFVFHL